MFNHNVIVLIINIILFGLIILNLLKVKKISNYVIFSYPLGLFPYCIIYFILDKLNICYNYFINYAFFAILFLIFILINIKNKIKIENDLKQIPIYFYIFIIYILVELIFSANESLFTWYNWDEFSGFLYGSKIASINGFEAIGFKKIMQAPFTIIQGSLFNRFLYNTYDLRLITPFFLALFALFMNISMIKYNVNKHISSLITMIFITSSPELLLLANTYYNNVYCIFYFFTGFMLTIEYFSKSEKENLILSLILLICSILTRNEIFYLLIVFLTFILIYYLIKKNKKQLRKSLIYIPSLVLFYIFWNVLINSYSTASTLGIAFSIEDLIDRLVPSSLLIFIKSALTQLFDISGYYMFTTAVISVVSVVFLLRMIYNKKVKVALDFQFILLVQFLYFNLIICTELVVFQKFEYLVAASFSRYMLLILPFSFMILGKLLNNCITKVDKE